MGMGDGRVDEDPGEGPGLGSGHVDAQPRRRRHNVQRERRTDRVGLLHQAILDVLTEAIADSSTSRVNLEHSNGFSYGEAFERFWQVYEREGEPCVNCGGRIRRIVHGGRSTYWCPRCQRR